MDENESKYSQRRYVPMARRKKRWVLPTIIIGVLLIIIIIPMIIFFSTIGSISKFTRTPNVEVKSNTVLTLELNGFNETSMSSPFAIFGGQGNTNTFFETITSIKSAKDDPNIKGIILKEGIGNYGFGKASELLNVLNEFKKSGKFVYSYFNYGMENTYYPALASDKIYTSSMGFMELNGFGASGFFFKNFFDKIGLEYYVEHFEDFKSAGEQFSRSSFSDSAKKELRVLLSQRFTELIDTIAKYRNLDRQFVLESINRGIYSPDSMLALKFIDGVMTEQDFNKEIYKKIFGKDLSDVSDLDKINYIDIKSYTRRDKPQGEQVADEHKKIAIIQAQGTISSSNQNSSYRGEEGITDGRYIEYLEKARKDKDVKAIILRIDSPGGSALASDNIWQKIREVRKEKPVYASMSDVAASGGYYIAMACDTIIAYPQTVTGSIGVITMIPNVSKLIGKIGITVDTISVGEDSQFFNGSLPFKEQDKAKFHNIVATMYYEFVSKAAECRHKSFEEMRQYAKGRVWTGEDALKIGLVDILGNWQTAIDIAKKRIGVPVDKKVIIEIYPKPKDEFEMFVDFFKHFGDNKVNNFKSTSRMLNLSKSQIALYQTLFENLPSNLKTQMIYNLQVMELTKNEKNLLVLPYYFEF